MVKAINYLFILTMSLFNFFISILFATAPVGLGYFTAKKNILGKIFKDNKSISTLSNSIITLLGVKFANVLSNPSLLIEVIYVSCTLFIVTVIFNCIGVKLWLFLLHNIHVSRIYSSNDYKDKSWTGLAERFKPLALLILGVLVGSILSIKSSVVELLIVISLIILLFFIGVSIFFQNKMLHELYSHNGLILAGIILTSVTASFVCFGFLDITFINSLGVSSGFGWASYAGLVISLEAGSWAGAIAFFCNFLRCITVVVLAPFVKAYPAYYLIAIGAGTSMDVSLPVIREMYGDSYLPLSLTCGFILTVATPLFLALLYM